MARRSLRNRSPVSYRELMGSFETREDYEAQQEQTSETENLEENLKCQIERLMEQSHCLHEAVSHYVSKVKSATKAWLEHGSSSHLSLTDMQEMIGDAMKFVTQSCSDIAVVAQETVQIRTSTGMITDIKATAEETYDTKQVEVKPKVSKISGQRITTLSCDVCQRQFTMKPKLSAHLRRHLYKFQYKCSDCNRSFQFKSHLGRHRLSHAGEKTFKCELCDKVFQGRQGLEKHREKHLPVRPEYKCDICQKVLGSKNYLQRHQQIHKKDNPFKCHICSKGCIDSKTLREHSRTHTGEKPFTCDICKNSFTRKSYLSQHIKCVHNREVRFECDVCGKKFVDRWYMNIHRQLHQPETPYLCDLCGKGYKNKYSLKSHRRTHTEEDPYICDVCGKGFKIKGGLKEHKKSHSDEKPHSCDICGKKFRDKSQLASHKWVHESERPFKCDICDKSFPWKGRLDLHKRIHSAERPFRCDLCGKSFKRKNDISKHNMKVHERKIPRTYNSEQGPMLNQNQIHCCSGITETGLDSLADGAYPCSQVDSQDRHIYGADPTVFHVTRMQPQADSCPVYVDLKVSSNLSLHDYNFDHNGNVERCSQQLCLPSRSDEISYNQRPSLQQSSSEKYPTYVPQQQQDPVCT